MDLELWKRSNVKIVENIIECEANSCGAFKNALINSGDKLLVEATIDEFWGTDLTLSQIKNTVGKYFKGSNVLRERMMSLRSNIQSEITSNSNVISDNSDDSNARSDSSLVQQNLSHAESTLSNKTTSILDSTTEATVSVSTSSNVNTLYLHKSLQS